MCRSYTSLKLPGNSAEMGVPTADHDAAERARATVPKG